MSAPPNPDRIRVQMRPREGSGWVPGGPTYEPCAPVGYTPSGFSEPSEYVRADIAAERERELMACIDTIVEMSQGDMDQFDAVFGVAHAALKRCPACFPKAEGKGTP